MIGAVIVGLVSAAVCLVAVGCFVVLPLLEWKIRSTWTKPVFSHTNSSATPVVSVGKSVETLEREGEVEQTFFAENPMRPSREAPTRVVPTPYVVDFDDEDAAAYRKILGSQPQQLH